MGGWVVGWMRMYVCSGWIDVCIYVCMHRCMYMYEEYQEELEQLEKGVNSKFTCFTSTKVQKMTLTRLPDGEAQAHREQG